MLVTSAALVMTFSQGASPAAAKKSRVDINTASKAELESVKGVGPAIAEKIIANRPYKSLEELGKAGLSAKKIRSLKSSLTVGAALSPSASGATRKEKMTSREERKNGEAKARSKAKESKVAAPGMGEPVDLNTAGLKTLETLPGVGRATAKRIIAARPFESVKDLMKVKGMSKAKVEALEDKVTVGAAHKAKPSATAPPQAVEKRSAAPESATPPATAQKKRAAGKLAPGQKVNINTADKNELDKLPGIGPVKAQAIIDGRPYNKVEDLMKVKGIKQHIFDRIKDSITVK